MPNTKKGFLLAIAAVSAFSLSACLTTVPLKPASDNAPTAEPNTSQPLFTDAYFKAHSIPPISYSNLVLAHVSNWIQESPKIDAKLAKEIAGFLALTNPEFNRLVHARKVSGITKETVPDEQIVEKYRPTIVSMASEGKVYWYVELNIDIVKRGELVQEYNDKEKGFTSQVTLPGYSNPYRPGQFANADYAEQIWLNPARISIFIPYSKSSYQQQVFDAISENRPLTKRYYGRFVFRIKDCRKPQNGTRLTSDTVTCIPKLTDYQIFEGKNITASQLVSGAMAQFSTAK